MGGKQPGLAQRLVARYIMALMTNPVRTRLTTTAISTVAGNVISQTLVEGTPITRLDWNRLRKVLVSSLVLSYLRHYQFQVINKILPPGSKDLVKILQALAVDQLIFAPLTNALFFVLMSLQEKKTPSLLKLQTDLRNKLWPSLLLYWRVWPAAKLISFFCVPVILRPIFGDMVGFLWAILLSTMTRQRPIRR